MIHRERIPPDVLHRQAAWEQRWFPPSPVRISILEDVVVTGEGLVFTDRLELIDVTVAQHTAADISAGRRAIIQDRDRLRTDRLRGDFLLCRKPGTRNYGHWLTEMLPKAWLAREYAGLEFVPVVQAVSGPLRRIMLETLGLLGFGQPFELGPAPARFDRLAIIDGLSDHGVHLSPLVVACLQDLTLHIPARPAGKLFLTRGDAQGRRFGAEQDLLRTVEAAGFRIFDPSRASFVEQVGLFKGATTVAGAMGAGLTNIAFMVPGSEVFVAAPDIMPDTLFWLLSGLKRLHHTEIRCRTAPPQFGPMPWDRTILLDTADQALLLAGRPPGAPTYDRETDEMTRLLGALFDPSYYLAQVQENPPPREEALLHYLEHGWLQGLAPSARFDGDAYLLAYDDVAQAGSNPLVHYLRHGRKEGRSIKPVPPVAP